jgi:hypothetical protein
MKKVPPRIHILFARETDFALILRRGPSKSVCAIGWDRGTNTFQVGQWINGRIYEEDCDLSPNGQYLIYKAFSTKWDGRRFGCTTAISRTPYLKPIGLWHSQEGTWIGGGLFIEDSRYWIQHGRLGHDTIRTPPALNETHESPFGEETIYGNIYFLRLQREDWTLVESRVFNQYTAVNIFDKPIDHSWILRKIVYVAATEQKGKGCSYDEHQLLRKGNTSSEFGHTKFDYPSWEWADTDHRGIYWAEKGKLFTAQLSKKGLESITELYDFNPMKFDPSDAPY